MIEGHQERFREVHPEKLKEPQEMIEMDQGETFVKNAAQGMIGAEKELHPVMLKGVVGVVMALLLVRVDGVTGVMSAAPHPATAPAMTGVEETEPHLVMVPMVVTVVEAAGVTGVGTMGPLELPLQEI